MLRVSIVAKKVGLDFKGATAPDIMDMPVIKTAKPSRMLPNALTLSRLPNICRHMPIMAMTAVIVVDEK